MILIVLSGAQGGAAPARGQAAQVGGAQWSLEEVRVMRRVFLLVDRSRVVDARGSETDALADALGPAGQRRARRHTYPYNVIARKLNEYIRKGHDMTAVKAASEADYVLYFNVLEYRRSLNGVYPYGELSVIVNGRGGEGPRPRVVWKTRKVLWAEDAVKEFLRELKRVRGQR
jgi:hypothetical protein